MTERFVTELSVTHRAGIAAYRPSMKAQLLVGAATLALIAPDALAQSAPKWDAHIDIGGRFGGDRQSGDVEVFVPLWQDQESLLFGNIRGKFGSHGDIEGNFGLGYRTKMDGTWILGVNGYFDVLETQFNNVFYQGGIGLEALTEDFDFRVNGYFPGSDPKAIVGGPARVMVVGNTIQLQTGIEQALWGFDGEVGWRLPLGGEDLEFRVFGGGFYFSGSSAPDIAGPQGRVEMQLYDLDFLSTNSRVEVGAGVSHDAVRDTRGYGSIRLRIPLQVIGDGTRLTGLDRRMTDRVVRDYDIVTGAGYGNDEDVFVEDLQNSTGDFWKADGGGPGDGTYEDPTYVNGAVGSASANAIIVVDGSNGGIGTGGGIGLKDGQALIGGGQTVKLTGATTGTMVMWTPAGMKPAISGTGEHTVIYLAEDNFVGGLGIYAAGFDHAIFGGSSTHNFFIHNNMIRDADAESIHLALYNPASRGKITDNMITGSGADGIEVDISVNAGGDGNSFDLLIDGNRVVNSRWDGIDVETDMNVGSSSSATFTQTITITDNVVTYDESENATGSQGIQVDTELEGYGATLVQEVTVNDNVVSRAGGVGIQVTNELDDGATLLQDNTININGNSVTYSDGSGIVVLTDLDNTDYAAYATQTININDNFVAGSYNRGESPATITGFSGFADGIDRAGFGIVVANVVRNDSYLNQDNTITISGNTVQNNDSSGIAVFNIVNGDDNNLDNTGGDETETIIQTLNITDNVVSDNGGDHLAFYFSWPDGMRQNVGNNDGITVVNIATNMGLIDQADTVNITGNTITNNYDDGLRVHNTVNDAILRQTFNINNNSIAYNGSDGIHFDARIDIDFTGDENHGFIYQDVTINGNTVVGNGGIYYGDQIEVEIDVDDAGMLTQYLEITNNLVSNGPEDGIDIDISVNQWGSVKQTATISGNTVTDIGNGTFTSAYADNGVELAISLSDNATIIQTLTVADNTISGSYNDGVYFYVSQSNDTIALLDWTFTDNTISGNDSNGIEIDLSLSNDAVLTLTALFEGNTIVDNGVSSGDGVKIDVYDQDQSTTANLDLTFLNNLITGNYDDGIDISISDDDGTGIMMLTLDVIDNTLADNFGDGLELDFSVNRTNQRGGMGVFNFHVAGNTITGNEGDGIDFEFSVNDDDSNAASLFVGGDFSNNLITGNGVSGSGDGIEFDLEISDVGSAVVRVGFYGNVVSGNDDEGIDISIDVYQSANLNATFNFVDNTVADNSGYGIAVNIENTREGVATLFLTFTDNTVNGNDYDGIYIFAEVDRSGETTLTATFMNNLVSDNGGDGIEIYLEGSSSESDVLNALLTFMNNTIVENDADGVYLHFEDSPDDETVTAMFMQNLITGNADDGVFVYTDWSDTFITFGSGNTIIGNGDTIGEYDIYAKADGDDNQILQLIGAGNTFGTVTYNDGWTNLP